MEDSIKDVVGVWRQEIILGVNCAGKSHFEAEKLATPWGGGILNNCGRVNKLASHAPAQSSRKGRAVENLTFAHCHGAPNAPMRR